MKFISIIQPKKPKGKGWIQGDQLPDNFNNGYPNQSWKFPEQKILVISAVEVVETEQVSEKLGPEYHLSISKNGGRCTSQEAKWVLRQFDLTYAEEYNHVPNGIVRHFWRPVADKYSGYQCPCKNSEPAIKQDKGDFIWRPAPKK